MKKITSFLVALLILVTGLQPVILSVGATGNEQENTTITAPLITSEGALVDLNASSVVDGQATFKVTLPAGGYAQFTQSIPGLIINSNDNTTDYVQIKVGDNTSTDLAAARFNVQLTDDKTAATDIVPVAEKADGSGENPGTDAMSWFILGSGGNVHYGKGSNTVGGPMIAAATHTNLLENGVRLSFSNNGDKVKGYIKAFAKELTSTKTKAEVGLDKELYVRLRNAASEAVTYTFNIFCTEIKAASFNENIITSNGAMVDLNASTLEDGKATYKVLLPQNAYAQVSHKLTDLIGGTGYVNVAVGDSLTADYQTTKYWVQLTDDASAATDIAPIQEKTSGTTEVDPGTDAMTWFMYGNGNYVIGGRGLNTVYFGTNFFVSSTCQTNGGMKMSFTSEADGKVGITTPLKTAYYPSYHTAEDVGIDEGAYVRIRSGAATATLYTITVVSADIKENEEPDSPLASQLITSEGASVDWKASSVVDGQATFKVTLPAGGYAQFTQKLANLIGSNSGNPHINIKIGNNTFADYTADTTWAQVQLTDDATAATDIVPIPEPSGANPSADAMTWMFQIYSNGNFYFNRGSNTNGATAAITPNEQFMTAGLRMRFDMDGDYVKGTLVGAAGRERTSIKTLADIGGTEGVYLRVRNAASQSVTYTFTIYCEDITEPEQPTNPLADQLITSSGASVDWNASSVVDGQATFKVTLPAAGYAQFTQNLKNIFGSNSGNPHINVVVGNGTAADYGATRTQIQLTDDATAATDIVPVIEGGTSATDPGTDGMTWNFWGTGDTGIIWAGLGQSTAGGTNLAAANNAAWLASGLRIRFDMNGENVKGTFLGIAGKDRTSQKTAAAVGLNNATYIRIRNGQDVAVTYTFTISCPDIKAPTTEGGGEGGGEGGNEGGGEGGGEPTPPTPPTPPVLVGEEKENSYDGKFKDYLYVTENGVVDETVTRVTTGTATLKVTLPAGGYFQYLQKLTDLLPSGQKGSASVKISLDDYNTTDVQVQLTADGEAKKDYIPVDEKNGKEGGTDPGAYAMTWRVIREGTTNELFLRSGASGGSYQNNFGVLSNAPMHSLPFFFSVNSDNKVTVSHTYNTVPGYANQSMPSTKTVQEVGLGDGAYVRIRNSGTASVTFTVVINSSSIYPIVSTAYKDGKWIFSDEDSVKISAESKEEKGIFYETLKVKLSAGGYAQLDEKLAYLLDNSNAKINIMVGDNTKAEWDAARVQIQLTADGEAKRDILPVNENNDDPGTLGMTWIFWGSGNQLWTGRGSTTAHGGIYGATNNLATVQSGLHVCFNRDGDKVAYNTTIGGLNITNTLPSNKTLAEIGGEEGLYVRLRNAAETEVTYTITIQYTKAIIEQEPVVMKGWTVKGETADGVSVTDETYDVNPGFRAWNLSLPHNTYAQYNTKITDLKDASFVWDIGEYNTDNYTSTFAFVLNPDAPWDVKEPGKDLREFKLVIMDEDSAIRILLPTGKVVEGQSNANPTIGVLPPVTTIEGQGGYTLGIVEKGGHYYLAICGVLLDGAQVGDSLEPYVRMDEYVEKGAYFRVYSRNGGYTNQCVSISSKVVPEIGSDEDEGLTDEDKALRDFLDFFTDNIEALRNNDVEMFAKLYKMWNELSYLNQGNVEAYFIDDSEPYDMIQLIKAFRPDEEEDSFTAETPEDEYVLITEYITEYITTTITTDTDVETDANGEESEEVIVPEEQKKPSKNKGTKAEDGGLELWVVIVIVAAAVVLVGAGAATVLVIRKKKSK